MVAGSIASLGSHYVLTLDAVNCQSGDTIARAQGEAGSKEEVLHVLGAVARDLRSRLGESLATIERYDAPVEEATTASFEALKAFQEGQALRNKGDEHGAIPLLERAVTLDPNFALAHARLGAAYFNERRFEAARGALTRAFELRNRTSERERLYIEARYTEVVRGDIPRMIEIYTRWKETYPRDLVAPVNLGTMYAEVGQVDQAIAETRTALTLDPDFPYPYANLAHWYLNLGRIDEAGTMIDEAVARGIDFSDIRLAMLRLALARNDREEANRHIDWFRDRGDLVTYDRLRAQFAAREGRLADALAFASRAADAAVRTGNVDAAVQSRIDMALATLLYGAPDAARSLASEALALSEDLVTLGRAADVFSLSGELSRAEGLIDRAAAELPASDTVGQQIMLPLRRATLQVGRGHPKTALEILGPVAEYDCRCRPWIPYIRAVAHLDAQQWSDAARDFENAFDISRTNPEYLTPFATLGIARAAAHSGDVERARRSYQDVLASWKDADEGLPTVERARVEYAALGQSSSSLR